MDLSLLLPALVSGVGFYLLIKLRLFFVFHPIKTARELIKGLKKRDDRRSFSLALAGTLGVGNIFGVSAGIMIGGPGSLFWMFISSLFAMVIKYAETLLVFDHGAERGGMASLVKRVLGRMGRIFAPLYAAFTIALALFMGSAMQSTAVIDTAARTLSIHPAVSMTILIALLMPCILGGVRKIESITEIIIPLTTIIYILMCLGVILSNFERFGDAITSVLSSAFSFRSTVGGGVSFLGVREGFARGILSNEAGVGTSAMAHARSRERSPHSAGLFAMCEVVFDSLLLCMLTGFAILVSPINICAFSTPMSLVIASFSETFGSTFTLILPFLILCFAYSTLICWYYYGRECVCVFYPRMSPIYLPVFMLFIFISSYLRSDFLLYVIDFILLVMSIITLFAILKRSKRIAAITLSAYRKNPE